jgi:hypothetical protein
MIMRFICERVQGDVPVAWWIGVAYLKSLFARHVFVHGWPMLVRVRIGDSAATKMHSIDS